MYTTEVRTFRDTVCNRHQVDSGRSYYPGSYPDFTDYTDRRPTFVS